MRSFKLLAAAALLLAACTPKAQIDCTVAQAPRSEVSVRLLDMNVFKVLDTVKTDASGRLRYKVDVKEGDPEFMYLYYKDTKIASLLLEKGSRVSVVADTLGNYSVTGSAESEKLREREKAYARFQADMDSTMEPAELSRIFIAHYRDNVKYVMGNMGSLTVVPVLFEQLDIYTPVFNQNTDAILFRKVCDSLKTVYPLSRYVKALEAETARRENALQVKYILDSAEERGYPDLNLPAISGERVSMSGLGAKAVLLHFWDSSDATHKMFNLDTLLPIWEKWHDKGFEIYSVDVNPDKSAWASVVKAQNLPWINVNDGRGLASSSLATYNVASVPSSFLLTDEGMAVTDLSGGDALQKELQRILK